MLKVGTGGKTSEEEDGNGQKEKDSELLSVSPWQLMLLL